jgi:hypothetical protein
MQVPLKFDKLNVYFAWRPICIYDSISLNSPQNRMFQEKLWRKQDTHFMFTYESCHLWDNVDNQCSQTGHGWQYNVVHARCVLDNLYNRHVLKICNNDCLFTANMATQTRTNITLHVHCFSCRMYDVPFLLDSCNTPSFSTRSAQLIFSTLLQHKIPEITVLRSEVSIVSKF